LIRYHHIVLESSIHSRRPYHSPRRQEQARLTRRAILDAALPLFVQHGYAGTSLGDIAHVAGVALRTVEATFGTKAKLLVALRDVTIAGDDDAIPVVDRAWYQEMLAEPDPRRQLELHARVSCQIKRRTAPLIEVIRRAAQFDPEISDLWRVFQEQYLADQWIVAESLAAKGALREPLTAADAAEIIAMPNHPSVYYFAVVERGWPEDRFERWLADAFTDQLLR
jgi:AcrR family transcriptional regulator